MAGTGREDARALESEKIQYGWRGDWVGLQKTSKLNFNLDFRKTKNFLPVFYIQAESYNFCDKINEISKSIVISNKSMLSMQLWRTWQPGNQAKEQTAPFSHVLIQKIKVNQKNSSLHIFTADKKSELFGQLHSLLSSLINLN